MAENGRVHPDCVNASNPYHECGVACLEKIAQGKGRKEQKKSDYRNGVNEGWLSKQKDGDRRAQPTCPKASNPYHNCDEFCTNRTAEATPRVVKKESGSILDAALSFGRKKKEPEPQQKSPRVVNKVPAVKAVHDAPSPTSPFSTKRGEDREYSQAVHNAPSPTSPVSTKREEDREFGQSFSSSQQHSDESDSQDNSFEKGLVRSPEPVHKSGNVTPDPPKSPVKISLACYKIPTSAELEQNEKPRSLPRADLYPAANHDAKATNHAIAEYQNFSFSGTSHASEDSDEEEAKSVISDSCVSVGKYHVRPNVSSTLQLIFDKYGDIAAGSRLESASMRAYYLECLCFVVQELQSTPFSQLTKSKVKEMLAVLKDVESAQINVSWLRDILSEIIAAMELNNQHRAAGEAKSSCDSVIESTRKELESMMEDLAEKEKAVADSKARIAETRAHLSELERESSQLSETILSIWSKVEKFHNKPLADEIL